MQASAELEQRCAVSGLEAAEGQCRVEAWLENVGEYLAGLLEAQEEMHRVRSSAVLEEVRRELASAEEGRKRLEAGLQEGQQESSERLLAAETRAQEAEAQLQQKAQAFEELAAKLQETREKAKQALQGMQEKKKQAEARVEEVEASLSQASEQRAELEAQLSSAKAELESRVAELDARSQELSRAVELQQGQELELAALRKASEAGQQHREELQAKLGALEDALRASRECGAELESQVVQLQAELQELRHQRDQAVAERQGFEEAQVSLAGCARTPPWVFSSPSFAFLFAFSQLANSRFSFSASWHVFKCFSWIGPHDLR